MRDFFFATYTPISIKTTEEVKYLLFGRNKSFLGEPGIEYTTWDFSILWKPDMPGQQYKVLHNFHSGEESYAL